MLKEKILEAGYPWVASAGQVKNGGGGSWWEILWSEFIGSITNWMRGVGKRDPFWVEDGFETST